MNYFKKFQSGLEKVMGPFATKVGESKLISALTEGFMCTMPITLGVAIIAILINLPIASWTAFLTDIGIYSVGQEFISLTLSLLAIYVVAAVGYCYTNNEKEKGIMGAVVALSSFIVLMPIQTSTTEAGTSISSLLTSQMGSDGIFVAIIVGLFSSWLFCKLMKMKLKLNLPSSVPPMVSESLAPTFVAMILFSLMFAIKYVFTLTSFGNIFNFVAVVIGEPIAKFGATPLSLIIVFSLMNLMWFFGIHPNAILSCYMPILLMVQTANIQAFTEGKELPFYLFGIIGAAVQIGGAGNTLGLCLATLFAKSEKYKAMRKLVIPANVFNINEPIIFGFPIMLNPIYFLPMVLSPAVSGGVAILLAKALPIRLNPAISMPWVTPGFVTTFFQGGLPYLLIWIVALFIHFAMYLPFFLIDDKNALKAERENGAVEEEIVEEVIEEGVIAGGAIQV